MAKKKYLFKLTPNKKDVVINTSVLLNGYEDVEYPIPIMDTEKLGYVYDPTTFKFKDKEHVKVDYPYPVRMEIDAYFKNLPFYGINSSCNTDKIRYNEIKPLKSNGADEYSSDPDYYNNYFQQNTSYDEGVFINARDSRDKNYNYTLANYKITVRIYWSDNKSHINENYIPKGLENSSTNGWRTKINNTYPFVLRLVPELYNIENSENIVDKNNYKELLLPNLEPNTDENSQDKNHKNIFNVPDNFTMKERNIVKFKIDATFTDPKSLMSVSAYKEVIVKQDAYIGYKTKYIKVKFIDYKPVDIWSPTVYASYNKDRNITYKIDKDTKQDYYAFYVKGSLDTSYYNNNKYKYFPDEKIYFNGAVDIDTSKKQIDSSNYFSLDTFIIDNYCINALEDSSVINEHILDSSDKDAFENRYTLCSSIAKQLGDFYDTSAYLHIISRPITSKKLIFPPIFDTSNFEFIKRYYRTPYSFSQINLMDTSAYGTTVINTSTNKVEYDSSYRAVYQKYYINNKNYYPINVSFIKNNNKTIPILDTSNEKYTYIDSSRDYDISDIMSRDIPVKQLDSSSLIYNYKVIQDEEGHSIETKYCINSLLDNDTNVQIPRYGVYPVFSGYIGFDTSVYDYQNKDKVEFDNSSTEIIKDLMYRKNGLLTINTNSSFLNAKIDININKDKFNEDVISQDNSFNDIVSTVNSKIINNAKFNNLTFSPDTNSNTLLYTASNKSNTYKYEIKINNNDVSNYLRINGVKYKDLTNGTLLSYADPGIFTLSLDDDYPKEISDSINLTIKHKDGDEITGELLITNDENEKHLTNYDNKGYELNTEHHSSMLLRANPKLSGNVKLVVDTDYKLYLDTFKANPVLNNKNVRKYPISSDGNYPRDIKKVFKNIPIKNLFGLPENSLKAHKVYNDYKDQYETMYEYGAETNTDSLYSENMKILAPLHIGNDIPEFFAIFRYDDVFNEETYSGKDINDIEKFKTLIKDSKVIKTYDLRTTTSIGQYLNNYKNMLSNYGQCYLQFIEQDYNQNSPYYRQGNNIWKGISVDRGILVNQSETTYFGSKILNSDIPNKQEMFNNYIIAGFERHNLIYSNIINLEFMFNDDDMKEYSMHRYFGLYLTANDFINYGYIVSSKNNTGNTVLTKYDEQGNIYKGDENIFNVIFNKNYYDRLFFAITNNNVGRVQTKIDLQKFFKNYVTNTPDSNLISLDSTEINIDKDNDKSFMILHFHKPIECGEHIKFIALDYPIVNKSFTNIANTYEENQLTTEHIVYELIASNDERLLETDYNINPYVGKQKCRYSENTYFYRISFYSQDTEYNDITASLDVQINRIIKCIEKFNTDIIRVQSYNDNSISIISSYDNMYVQHILPPKFDDFSYDYTAYTGINGIIYTTNKEYTDSLDFLPHKEIKYIENNSLAHDDENDWITYVNDKSINCWHCYVESEDINNIKSDTISYFNNNMTYKMHALTNQSDFFDNYYCAFSNYSFEILGWRYNNIVKFESTKKLNYTYQINTDIADLINKVKYPLVYNVNGIYDTVNTFNIINGYLRNNIFETDLYKNYTINDQQQIIDTVQNVCVITNPYDVDTCMISTINESLLITNKIHLYKPTAVSVSIMGITNIKDIDTTIDLSRTLHNEDNLIINIPAGTSIATDESDYRIQYGIMYEVINGKLKFNRGIAQKGTKFLITPKNIYISSTTNQMTKTIPYISFVDNTVLKIVDKQKYQTYNYDTEIPELKSTNYFANPKNTNNSELLWPIVPLTQCLWKSNGQYYDNNNILDVNTLNEKYEVKGNFCENIYTASDYDTNQYVTNKVDNILYINNESTTYKESILNGSVQHSIKKLLIDNANIDTASVYYNSNIKSLEFIFSGIKFNIKLNTKIINSYIHLEDYSGFEAFVLTDYDLTKSNELYISLKEKFILLINHQFYIDYQHEGANNIKNLTDDEYQSYADYAVLNSPYDIDFRTVVSTNNSILSHKRNNFHKKLLSIIDRHNMWSSLFVQYDIPNVTMTENDIDLNKPQFVTYSLEDTIDCDEYVSVNNVYDRGLLYNSESGFIVNTPTNINSLDIISSDSHSYVITKADGDYNHTAKQILERVIDLTTLKENYTAQLLNISNVLFPKQISLNETKLAATINRTQYNPTQLKLSNILNSNQFIMAYKDKSTGLLKRTKLMTGNNLVQLKEYISKLITTESAKDKLTRYVNSFTNVVDVYIIPNSSEVKHIQNTEEYNPLIFTLSIPNQIKFNYGWFTPNTNNMFDFYVDDELKDILNVDLLQSNTKLKSINRIKNYTGNKVFEDTKLQKLNKNYYLINERSLLSATWDNNYYRKYTSENEYTSIDGHKTGIDDKSFFGSHCMVIHNEYILLNTWSYPTANDILTVKFSDASFNMSANNQRTTTITINISSAIFNHFINNNQFNENWIYFKDSQYTGQKNYINNTLSVYYNDKSKIEVEIFSKDTEPNSVINIVTEKPDNLSTYNKYENYSTKFETKENLNTLTIVLNETTGKNIYPTVKIYKR